MKYRRLVGSAAGALVAVSLALTGCGKTSPGSGVEKGTVKAPDKKAGAALIAALPADLQALYEGFSDPVLAPAYGDFTMSKPPWKVCLAYDAANSWIQEVRKEMERVVAEFRKAGKTSGGLEVAETGGEVARENRQVRALIARGCSLILLAPASPGGSNAAIKAAYDKGVPVVSFGGAVTSPYAVNVVPNSTLYGRQQAEEIAAKIKNRGNVIMVGGIEGLPASIAQQNGADQVWRRTGIKVAARVYGKYDIATTKSAVLQALAGHPEPIAAVWTAGSEIRAVIEAFRQAGRPVPVITGTPSADVLAMMKADPGLDLFGRASVPLPVADTAIRVAFRMLDGQRPRIGTLTFTLPAWNRGTLDQWLGPCMKPDSQLPFPVPPRSVLTEEQLNGYFTGGRATPPYVYDPPSACR